MIYYRGNGRWAIYYPNKDAKIIAHKLLSIFPNTPRGVMYALSTTSALLSALIANTTTALLLVPIALFLTNDTKL